MCWENCCTTIARIDTSMNEDDIANVRCPGNLFYRSISRLLNDVMKGFALDKIH